MPFAPGQSGNPDTQFQPGQSGNPAGKPKGARHLRSIIQEMLGDEDFEQKLKDGTTLKGAPIRLIAKIAIAQSMSKGSDGKAARDWLAKYGIGMRMDLDQKLEASGDIHITFESNDKPPAPNAN